MKVFLGGTCNGSTWREKLIDMLTIDYFNPVVKDWTPECQEEEIKQRKECDYCLYCITPLMTGIYSIAEAVDDSNKRSEKTIIVCLENDNSIAFTEHQWKSLKQFMKLCDINGAKVCFSLREVAHYLNCR